MLKNRGMLKSRSYYKKNRIPKLKQKRKFRQAVHKMISKGGRRRRGEAERYDGESNGINVGVNRATDLK